MSSKGTENLNQKSNPLFEEVVAMGTNNNVSSASVESSRNYGGDMDETYQCVDTRHMKFDALRDSFVYDEKIRKFGHNRLFWNDETMVADEPLMAARLELDGIVYGKMADREDVAAREWFCLACGAVTKRDRSQCQEMGYYYKERASMYRSEASKVLTRYNQFIQTGKCGIAS